MPSKSTSDNNADQPTELLDPISASAHTVRPVVNGPKESVQTTIHRNEGRFRHGVAAAIVSICLVFCLGLGGGMVMRHIQSERENAQIMAENERKAAEAAEAQRIADEEAEAARLLEEATRPRELKFIVSAADYDSMSTRIPLSITGIDLQGEEVQTEGFIGPEGGGLALAPGEYTASIPASPIRANGSMYKVPTSTYSFKVPNDDQETISVDQAIVLIPLNIAELTEDIVNNAYTWAMKDVGNESVAEANASAARKVLEEEAARKREEERKAKRREELPPIAQNFAEDYFTNIAFPNDDDDSEVLVITNWPDVVGQYVAEDSTAERKIGGNPGAAYSFATRVSATDISDSTVTVQVSVIQDSEVKSGWTKEVKTKTISVTFNDDNEVTDFSVS